MSIGRFFKLEFARSDPVHGIFLTGLELLDFVEVESFHLLAERLHLVTVSACFFDSDATHFEFFQASDLLIDYFKLTVCHWTASPISGSSIGGIVIRTCI